MGSDPPVVGVDALGVDIACERGHREQTARIAGQSVRWMVPSSSLYFSSRAASTAENVTHQSLILPAEVVTTAG
jgi:hypothetical protein